jgi:2-polyprenyl-3-methyl-5-hydroxy-6-metoxy-1,4-benzoquinol methylase
MDMATCPACLCNESPILFAKRNTNYHQCRKCRTLFAPHGLSQQGKIGGRHEFERNSVQNGTRIERLLELSAGKKARVLDFGCGHGLFVSTLITLGWNAVGYDAFNPQFSQMPEGQFELATMVEVVEHLAAPFSEITMLLQHLKGKGFLMVETSFVDFYQDLKGWEYVEPEVGHCTIFSHAGLDLMMTRMGFRVSPPINRNVRIFQKP